VGTSASQTYPAGQGSAVEPVVQNWEQVPLIVCEFKKQLHVAAVVDDPLSAAVHAVPIVLVGATTFVRQAPSSTWQKLPVGQSASFVQPPKQYPTPTIAVPPSGRVAV
jgi:hypothetical protein